jgi:hypothetical protein
VAVFAAAAHEQTAEKARHQWVAHGGREFFTGNTRQLIHLANISELVKLHAWPVGRRYVDNC